VPRKAIASYNWRIVWAGVAAVICAAFSPPLFAADRPVVRIGVIAPLTGGMANLGDAIKQTALALAPKFNSLSRAYRYEVRIDDGKCGGSSAPVVAAHKLIDIDKVGFLLTGCSAETIPAAPLAEHKHVVTFAVASNHESIKNLGDYIFRTYVDIAQGVRLISDFIRRQGHKRLAFFTEENSFTVGMAKLYADDLAGEIVWSDTFQADSGDLGALVLRAKAANPDSLYLNCAQPRTCAELVNRCRALGLNQPMYSYYYFDNSDVRQAIGERGVGLTYLSTPSPKDTSPAFEEFLRSLRPSLTHGVSDEFIVRTTYDALMALFNSIETVGPRPEAVKDYLYHYRARGALGDISFDKNGDIKNVSLELKEITPGATARPVPWHLKESPQL